LVALFPLPGQSPAASARVRSVLRRLSIDEQAAQLVMPWIAGSYASFDGRALEQAVRWIDSLRVGGIVVSIGSPLDIAAKLNFLQRRSRLPLLVASDLEGGSAFRFEGGTPFPTNMGVAATGRERDAYLMGRITAFEGRAVGIHITFSPVADVNNNPANPIINTRSFGADPTRVARLVAETIRGIQSTGMLATAKHFPGHGDTDTDTHLALPLIRGDWARLRAVELAPFRAAVAAGVAAVMSAHVALPAVEPDTLRPATLSRSIMRGVLRDSLRFRGMVVTDALDMGALGTRAGAGELAVQALEAGADLLLMPTDPAEAVRAVAAAVRSGRLTRARLRESVARVLTAKEKAGLFAHRSVSLDRLGSVVGRRAYLDSARAVSARAVVLVRDTVGAVDRLRSAPGEIAVVTFSDGPEPAVGSAFQAGLASRGHRVIRVARLVPASGPASYDSARAALASAPTAVFAVAVRVSSARGSVAMPEALASLVEATARERPVILVSFGSPYLLTQTPSVASLLLAWTANPLAEDAAAAALAGAAISGTLPIDLPPYYGMGHGLARAARVAPAVPPRRLELLQVPDRLIGGLVVETDRLGRDPEVGLGWPASSTPGRRTGP
jgi:beta-N-acetylhexosaminidase